MAARLFSVPISIISLVDHDRIWFKSHHGLDVQQIDRAPGLCASAILQDDPWVLTDAKADHQQLAVILDTGSQVSIGNPALRQRLIERRMLGAPEAITILSVTGASLQGEYMVLKKLEIGGVTLTNLAIVFADAHTFKQLGLDRKPALLLGMNAMRAFERVSIDFARKKLRVKMPKSSNAEGVMLASRVFN